MLFVLTKIFIGTAYENSIMLNKTMLICNTVFTLNGNVKSQNNRYGCSKNPQTVHEVHQLTDSDEQIPTVLSG